MLRENLKKFRQQEKDRGRILWNAVIAKPCPAQLIREYISYFPQDIEILHVVALYSHGEESLANTLLQRVSPKQDEETKFIFSAIVSELSKLSHESVQGSK